MSSSWSCFGAKCQSDDSFNSLKPIKKPTFVGSASIFAESKSKFMYTQVWTKYLPIIRILLKRSATAEQTLDMNRIDFERAGSGRKAGYKFIIEFRKGRVSNLISSSPLASNLATVLLQDAVVKDLFQKVDYDISLNTRFQLHIKNLSTEQGALQEADHVASSGSDSSDSSSN